MSPNYKNRDEELYRVTDFRPPHVRLLSQTEPEEGSRLLGRVLPKRLVVSFAKSQYLFIYFNLSVYISHSSWMLSDSEDIVLLTHHERDRVTDWTIIFFICEKSAGTWKLLGRSDLDRTSCSHKR